MNLLRIIFAALLGLLSSSLFVFAKDTKENNETEESNTISTDSGMKQYVITFQDGATTADFSEITQWITDNKGEIVEKINENFAKLIIAKSDPSIRKLYFL